MNRKELLQLLVNQAQFNGFEFQHWFQSNIQPVWPGTDQAHAVLAAEGRHFALLFSHDFVRSYLRSGVRISFSVPSITYPRINSEGAVVFITRKPFTRRTVKPDAWKYHLRQMAAADDPIAYLCRFLPEQDQDDLRAGQLEDENAQSAVQALCSA